MVAGVWSDERRRLRPRSFAYLRGKCDAWQDKGSIKDHAVAVAGTVLSHVVLPLPISGAYLHIRLSDHRA